VGVHRPRLELLLAVAAGLSVLLAWAVPKPLFNPTVNVVHGLLFPAAAYGTGLILLRERRSHPAEAALYLATGSAALAFAVHDLLIQFGRGGSGAPFLLPYVVPLMLLAFGSTLVVRFAPALRSSEALNRDLEQRVVENTASSSTATRTAARSSAQAARGGARAAGARDARRPGRAAVSLLSLVERDSGSDPRVAPAAARGARRHAAVIDSLDPALQTIGGAWAARACFEPRAAAADCGSSGRRATSGRRGWARRTTSRCCESSRRRS
jgi:hypothetical protein